ncbi:MAG: dihydrofolate reductase [Sphingomonadaceae bacterium]|nr:dihydrofolate reductase [Sphingomonadaceae bacterium]
MAQQLFAIYARAANGVIGKDGQLPWHIPADLKRFKALTMGKPMLMGRKTFESFPKPLPGRRHIVLTRDTDWNADGAEVVHSIGEALEVAGEGDVAVIGGAEIYALFMPLCSRVELTDVHRAYEGDTHMDALSDEEWAVTGREDFPAEGDQPPYSYVTLTRRSAA